MSGVFALSQGATVRYVGQSIEEFNDSVWIKSVYSTKKKECYFLFCDRRPEQRNQPTNEECLKTKVLVYNKDFGRWSLIEPDRDRRIRDISVCQGNLIMIMADGSLIREELEEVSTGAVARKCRLEMDWFNLRDIQGYIRLRQINILYDFRGREDTVLNGRIWYDYEEKSNNIERFAIRYEGQKAAKDSNRIFRFKPIRQKCSAFKLTIEEETGNPFTISGLTIKYASEAEGILNVAVGGS